ncbi:molybdopterin-dependent oxidoreductase [Microlunatus speluncae]|uniref:molybdopterin-dependent oxidoreductase n=1 Tax=Microlunatus speluncae TaxID=2594267 RepID=UPI0012663A07|nr:molybdopterin-dependent oxidoreductase [Microlunatus speluncae]
MEQHEATRRAVLKGGGAAVAGLTLWQVAGPAQAFPQQPGSGPETVIEWDDEVPDSPVPPEGLRNLLDWEQLKTWYTPADNFFVVNHYNEPALTGADWRLSIGGLVDHRKTLSLADLRAAPRREVDFTLECSGNTGLPFFIGGIGNGRWAGTPLAPLLKMAGVRKDGREVVFWGADAGEVTVRDNSGVLEGGQTGSVVPNSSGGLDLTITERFARSMSLADAMSPDNLLCYELNGAPLPREHGFPVRLIAPGWYGVANVKWLTEIEVRDGRYQGRFMARDYVTVREEVRNGQTRWTFTTVARDRLKSAPAKVTRRDGHYAVFGAAWGAPIDRVQVRIDQGPWQRAQLVRQSGRGHGSRDFAWTFWRFPWGRPPAGQHTVTSRAIDSNGKVQPTPDDPFLAAKVTYWESNGQITRRVTIPAT